MERTGFEIAVVEGDGQAAVVARPQVNGVTSFLTVEQESKLTRDAGEILRTDRRKFAHTETGTDLT
jgi:hypothetical protein